MKADGSISAKIEYYAYEALDFVKANPWVGVFPVLLLIATVFLCKFLSFMRLYVANLPQNGCPFMSGIRRSGSEAPVKEEEEEVEVDESEEVAEGENAEETEEKTEEADNLGEGIRQRKNKAPKAE